MAEEKRKVVAIKAKAKPKAETLEGARVETLEEPKAETLKELQTEPSVFEEPVARETLVEAPVVEEPAPAKAEEPEAPAKTPLWKKWWFWFIVAGLALALIALLLQNPGTKVPGSNANTTASTTAAGDVSATPSTAATTVRADGNVDITLPPEFFEGQTKEEIEAAAKADGIAGVVVHEDGSVTYTMTQAQRAQLLTQYRGIINDTINSCTSGAEGGPKSFRSISYNNNVDRFDIKVDKSTYNRNKLTDSQYVQAFYLLGAYYQTINGIPKDQVDVTVNIYDESNYELLDAGTYQQFLAEQ